jgi:hypothetical protein
VLDVIGREENLIYCAIDIPREPTPRCPAAGLDFLTAAEHAALSAPQRVAR